MPDGTFEDLDFDGFRFDFVKGFGTWMIGLLAKYQYEKKDGREQTREDARGAIIGAAALATFAAVGSVLLSRTDSLLALALALASWAGVCVIGYVASQATPRRSDPRRGLARLGFATRRERRGGFDRRDRPVPPRGP